MDGIHTNLLALLFLQFYLAIELHRVAALETLQSIAQAGRFLPSSDLS